MARSTRRGSAADRGLNAAPPADEADRIIDAAFAQIATEGWRRLSLATVAAASGLPILRVYRNFPSKQAILCGFPWPDRRRRLLAEPPAAEEGERPRDRLFDLMMRRFDALRPYKPALEALRRELPADPPSVLVAGAALLRSIRWMHEAADIATGGLRGAIAVRLTGAAYLAAARVWHRDDSQDLGQTMAALDARLRRVEGWLTPTRPPRTDGEALSA